MAGLKINIKTKITKVIKSIKYKSCLAKISGIPKFPKNELIPKTKFSNPIKNLYFNYINIIIITLK